MGKQVSKLGGPSGRRHQEIPEEALTFSTLYKEPPPLELRLVRRLILGRKLAPMWRGVSELPDGANRWEYEECPICLMLYKGGLNRSVCCRQSICSECFLQMATATGSLVQSAKPCPYCNSSNFRLVFVGPLSPAEISKVKGEEARTRQVEDRIRAEEERRDRERLEKKMKDAEERAVASVDSGQTGVVGAVNGGPDLRGGSPVVRPPEPPGAVGDAEPEEEISADGDSGDLQAGHAEGVGTNAAGDCAGPQPHSPVADPAVLAERFGAAVVQLARRLEQHSSPSDDELAALDDDQLALALALSMRDANFS